MNSHFLKKIVLFFMCCLINYCSFEQVLLHTLDVQFTVQILAKSHPSTGTWLLTKNVGFNHWVLRAPKCFLVPEFKVETLCPGKGSVPEFWCEYLEKINGLSHICPARIIPRHRASVNINSGQNSYETKGQTSWKKWKCHEAANMQTVRIRH